MSKSVSLATATLDQDQQISILFRLSRVLASAHDFEELPAQLLDTLLKSGNLDAGIFMLYTQDRNLLTPRAVQGYDLQKLDLASLVPGELTQSQAELYNTPESAASMIPAQTGLTAQSLETARQGTEVPHSALALPLRDGETPVGLLILENRRQPRTISDADLSFWEQVAGLVTLAILNARRIRDGLAAQALNEANRLKAELVSILGHEMRTPLTSIKGYSTALLMEEADFSSQTQREFLRIIDEECDVLQNLIRDLLESSIIDAGLLRIELQPVRISRLVESVVNDISHHSRDHQLVLDFPDDCPIVDADPERVAQVLRNLLDNAIKYSPEGGLVVVRAELDEDEIIISVSDQGVGIAPDDLNRLFEKFFRVKSGLGRHVVGSGLGLPISRAIVESHGGRIWAESRVGQGTTLYFTLPLDGPSQGLVG